jgi:hypothetical protein
MARIYPQVRQIPIPSFTPLQEIFFDIQDSISMPRQAKPPEIRQSEFELADDIAFSGNQSAQLEFFRASPAKSQTGYSKS